MPPEPHLGSRMALLVLLLQLHRLPGAARQCRLDGEDHGVIAVPRIPFRALDVVRTGRLLQLVVSYRLLQKVADRGQSPVMFCLLGRLARSRCLAGLHTHSRQRIGLK